MDAFVSIFSDKEWALYAAIGGVVSAIVAAILFAEKLALWLGWIVLPIRRWLSNPHTYGDYTLPDHRIIGRDAEVSKIGHVIRARKRGVLIGAGGLGKSTIARYFVSKRKENYRGVWWIDASDPVKLREAMEALAKTLDPALKGETDTNLLIARARDGIGETRQRWLLIFDNSESPRALRPFMPDPRKGLEVIVTTRWNEWPEGGHYTRMPLEPLDFSTERGPAVALLMQEAERTNDRAGARGLAEALGGLPLALMQAGAWLRDPPGSSKSFAECTERIDDLLRLTPPIDYRSEIFAAVSLSLEQLGPEAAQIANLLAFWAPEGLQPAFFKPVGAKDAAHERYRPIPVDLWPVLREEGTVARAFAELARRSLVERRGEGEAALFAMHRLTGAVIREGLGAGGREQWREAAASVLAAAYPSGDQGPMYRVSWPLCAALTPHVEALAGHGATSAAADYVYNQASIWLGQMRQDLPALMLARAALRAKKRRLDPLHRDVGVGYTTLGLRWRNLGRPLIAEKLLRRAAEISEQNPEIGDEDRAIDFSNHGGALLDLGRRAQAAGREEEADGFFRRAGRRYQQALLLARRRGDRRAVAYRLNNLGTLRAAQDRRAAAIRLGRMALGIYREVLAPDDPALATSLHNLASPLLQSSDWREAEPLFDEALAIREDAFAAFPRHPSRVSTARYLTTAALMRGDRAKAEQIIARYPDDIDLARQQRDALMRHLHITAEAGEAGPDAFDEILGLMGLTVEDGQRLMAELRAQTKPAPQDPE